MAGLGSTARKWQSQDLKPGCLMPALVRCTTVCSGGRNLHECGCREPMAMVVRGSYRSQGLNGFLPGLVPPQGQRLAAENQ